MADIGGTYSSNRSYYPYIDYGISYSEIGRTASSITYNVNVTYNRVTSHYYGYDIQIHYQIGNTIENRQLKSTSDLQSTSINFNVVTTADSDGGTIYAHMYSYSNTDTTHSQNGFDTTPHTMNKSSSYVMPPMPTINSISGVYANGGTTTVNFGGHLPVTGYKVYYREWTKIGDSYGAWNYHGMNESMSGIYSIGHGKVNGDAIQMAVTEINGPYESAKAESGWIYHQGCSVYNNGFKNGNLKVWNGSSWVQGYVRVWNGSAWVIGQ